jgi:hypothetical protein
MAMGQMATVREIHPENGVARLQQRQVDAHVRLRARVWLHVGVLGAKERLRPFDRQRLDDIHEFAAAVVTLARIALGVLVREHRTGGFEDRRAHEVLRRDQFEAERLAVGFLADRRGDLGV